MKFKGIIFDLDGTLADTLPVCLQAYQVTIEHFTNLTPTEEEITRYFGTSDEGILEKFFPGKLNDVLPYYLEQYEQLHVRLCANPFPGVDKALTILKAKGVQTAIVSGKGAPSAAISMRILGLTRWINMVETGFPDRADKPFSIKKILDQWGIQPGQVAYVGDTPYDMSASREAGLTPIGAAWAATTTLELEPASSAHKVFHNVDDFIQWVEMG